MIGDRTMLAEIGGSGRSVLDRGREKGFDRTSWRKMEPRRLGRRSGLDRICGVEARNPAHDETLNRKASS